MTEFRRDPLIRRWVVTGFAREDQPDDSLPSAKKDSKEACPFCEGSEFKTPPEAYAIRKDGSQPNGPGWEVRVVPNRATDMHVGELQKRAQGGVYDLQNASGIHETVVETPRHSHRFSHLDVDQIAKVLRTLQYRNQEHKKNHILKGTLLFRNLGRGSAGIYKHVHSHIVSFPFVPKTVKDELAGAREFYSLKTRCIFCDMIAEETKLNRRIVFENAHYLAWCPFASRFPYECWVIPKEHRSEFLAADPGTFTDLAKILKTVLLKIEKIVGDTPTSFVLHTAPLRSETQEDDSAVFNAYHWHIEILPHALPAGGFEWGGDFYLSPPTPESCAEALARVHPEDGEK